MRQWTRKSKKMDQWGPRDGRRRIVVENTDGAEGWVECKILEQAGYDVRVCEGPLGVPHGDCPLIDEGHCEWVEGADAVISSLPLGYKEHREVVEAIKGRLPEKPLVLVATRLEKDRFADVIGDAPVVFLPLLKDHLLDAVDQVLGERSEEPLHS